jgi:predicted ATP-dependent serine protease
LTGRLRPATQAERRLEECGKLGLDAVLAPPGTPKKSGLKTVEADTIGRAISAGLSAASTDS